METPKNTGECASSGLRDRDLPEMSENERIVRGAWESCDVEDHRMCCGPSDKKLWRAVIEPRWSTWADTPSAAWSAARAYTDEVLEEARQRREEIEYMEENVDRCTKQGRSESIPYSILKRLEDEYAEHVRGLRKEFLEGE